MRVRRSLALFGAALLLVAACSPSAAPNPTSRVRPIFATQTSAPTFSLPTTTPTVFAEPTPTATLAPASATPPPATQPPATQPPAPTATPAPAVGSAPTGATQQARVVRVVDGDTIRVEIDGQEFPLRYIGIDTPETVHPSKPVEWMGKEASDANRGLVEGQMVVLEKDVSETDRYGRLLRYVWLTDGAGWLLVNHELVRLGFAQASTYPPDVKYTDLFLDAQRAARDGGLGLWGDPPPDDGDPGDGGGGESCDSSYPGVCIPPAPPDLDCADVPFNDFTVLSPDPHRFDGDYDGFGCET